ncbi:MAG: PQQ-binding-like beta-propeller repeat protein [Planctomycetota bacterium]
MKSSRLLLAVIACFGVCSIAQAEDWPQFRGPSGNGVLEELQHPQTWSSEDNMAWSVDLPGGGLSSPIVSGNRIFLTTAVGAEIPVGFAEGVRDMRPKKPDADVQFQVVCLNLEDGSEVWTTTVTEQQPEYPIHGSNSYATESPATDGKQLYVYFAATGTVAALDLDGQEVWRQDIGSYPTGNGFGTGSSLTVGEGKVFIQCDNDENSFVVAFDAETGEEAWKHERRSRTSWSTPLLWKNDQRVELITCGSGFVTSYDPASGDEFWTMTGISSAFSASPAADSERIYFGNSGPMSSGPLLAVETGLSGDSEFVPDMQAEGLSWSKMQAGPGMSSPVSTGGYLYIPGRGILTCYSAEDGTVAYKERLPMGSMAASMWAAGDSVFLMDESGKTLVLERGPEMNVIATNQIEDDLFWSTPAIAGNSLLIRGSKKLYCIRE